MKDIITLQQLQGAMASMTINPLRDLARQYNIVPGNKKRADLEREIQEVFLGNAMPTQRKKTGRPTRVSGEVIQLHAPALDEPMLDVDAVLGVNQEEDGASAEQEDIVVGMLEVMPDGFGFIRVNSYGANSTDDVYVPPTQIKRFNLKMGDRVKGKARNFADRNRASLIYIYEINDVATKDHHSKVTFDSLLPCNPDQRMTLEMGKSDYALRAIDLVAPIGRGQRGLIVAPPKTGKTILLKRIAQSIRHNYPEVHLTVLLIDERPEEVTDFKECVDCDVAYSTFDQSAQHHTRIAEMVVNNAKRRVEQGQDVMILMDSITRLARAYNQTASNSGRTLTGGLDISALQEPKKIFGAGRNVKGGGSLTILATALIETGSKMDDIIYEEFKGTGNMEIHLDRRMSEKRIFPAIDLAKSGTRREELLLTQTQLEAMYIIRKRLSNTDTVKATEELLDVMTCTANNADFVDTLKRLSVAKAK